jgi:lipopolysaccharide/colanic/teichoic acid biosynthesis glycosyltransferase
MFKPIKRIFDFILSLLAIIILSPLFIFVAILVRLNLGSPVLFRQKRVGQYNKVFTLYKFRSMRVAFDNDGNLLPDDQRLTKFGLFLRKTSIDELPQLFNILFGQMTIIGPRPKTIFETLLMQNTSYVYRTAIKPGLSSWSVIHGRNNIRNDAALTYDLEHVARDSFGLDVKIFLKTILMVLKGSGISTEGHATFLHLSDFLLEHKLMTKEQVVSLRQQSLEVERQKLKYIPLEITKHDFISKRREFREIKKNFTPQATPTWE